MRERDFGLGALQCGCVTLIAGFNLWIGGWSVSYLLTFFLNKTIPLLPAMLIGLFTAEISVPVAVVIAILKHYRAL